MRVFPTPTEFHFGTANTFLQRYILHAPKMQTATGRLELVEPYGKSCSTRFLRISSRIPEAPTEWHWSQVVAGLGEWAQVHMIQN